MPYDAQNSAEFSIIRDIHKYSDNPYTIDKKYMENLRNKVALFRQLTKTRKGIALTMITSSGLMKNSYSMNNIHSQLAADKLFVDA